MARRTDLNTSRTLAGSLTCRSTPAISTSCRRGEGEDDAAARSWLRRAPEAADSGNRVGNAAVIFGVIDAEPVCRPSLNAFRRRLDPIGVSASVVVRTNQADHLIMLRLALSDLGRSSFGGGVHGAIHLHFPPTRSLPT